MKAIVWALVLLLAVPAAVFAESTRLSLRDAVEAAFKRNNLLQSASYTKEAAQRAVEVRRSSFWPQVGLEESAAISNSPTRTFMMKLDQGKFTQQDFQIDNLNHPSTYGDFKTSLQLALPIFDPALRANLHMAQDELAVQDISLQRQRQEVALQVYQAFLDISTAEAYASVADQAVNNATEHLRVARVRVGAGTGLKSDELRARTFLADSEQQRLRCENDLKIAKLRLALVLGMDGKAVDIVDTLAPLPVPKTGDELVEVALRERSDLREAEAEVQKASTGIALARSSYLPSLYGNASYQLNDRDIPFGRDNDSWSAGVGLRWEVFDGFRRKNEVAKAAALRNAAAEVLQYRKKEAVLQVNETQLRREESIRRLDVSRHSVDDAEETVRLIKKRFENSLATMVELLDAQTSLNRARTQVVENEAGVARASALLLHSAGIFLQEVLK